MNLELILKAATELEKKIAADQYLRRYLASVWAGNKPGKPLKKTAAAPDSPQTSAPASPQHFTLTFDFPLGMCELLERAAELTGKSPTQLLEESFADYYFTKIEKPTLEPGVPPSR